MPGWGATLMDVSPQGNLGCGEVSVLAKSRQSVRQWQYKNEYKRVPDLTKEERGVEGGIS